MMQVNRNPRGAARDILSGLLFFGVMALALCADHLAAVLPV